MRKIRSIVVDDEAHIRLFLRTVLQRAGLDVVGEAVNGDEGLLLVEKEMPDLVLMDINMPVKTGDEVIADMKRRSPMSKIIMLTSVADAGTITRCIEAGADDYIRKDTPYQEMAALIKEIIGDMEVEV
ncbi:two-component system chemotaxis response regulator CheY/two-component system response regulator DesR [Desulfobotulus alkaliphilus]|uniref:Two-component system chemotaxis response regulator CheY/two-component system response regulator DesR n=1 Tax=Desulfobotulus alkaliphilus TaxID=622671 RepID=A0A562RRS6_9BACT|nr:response regulator transcription factor [Desulfobotulus alkaliphilus]TWI71244.1 two-component system chemotaxis response regulator CheY/two-component system response regulator DesR [Desulfobotulus alkaliphilus]